jgi:hypothetical protein
MFDVGSHRLSEEFRGKADFSDVWLLNERFDVASCCMANVSFKPRLQRVDRLHFSLMDRR